MIALKVTITFLVPLLVLVNIVTFRQQNPVVQNPRCIMCFSYAQLSHFSFYFIHDKSYWFNNLQNALAQILAERSR